MKRYAAFLGTLAALGGYASLKAAAAFPACALPAAAAGLVPPALAVWWQVSYRNGTLDEDSLGARALAWVAAAGLGVWATFLLLSAAGDAVSLLPRVELPGAAVAAAAGLIATAGLAQALAGPRARELEVPIEGLPAGLDGLRIVHLSDLHIGPTIRRKEVAAVVERALALKPDLIAVTGDLVDGAPARLARQVAPLAALRAPLGVYFVTGNHEYYWDAPAWLAQVRELGLTPLVNEGVVLSREGDRFLVAGVPDESGGHFVEGHFPHHRAAAIGPADFKILLAHRPDGVPAAERAGFRLQLSGHTHGGQFFPASLFIGLFHRFTRGLARHGRMWVHVSPGTGYWGPPHRFGVPAEITALTLRRG
ncbi:MAG: metallophosphoesterase [Elusimicrobiota bacterium]|nr:metallophosphoesterase [Elusimicrobiota bacterium]